MSNIFEHCYLEFRVPQNSFRENSVAWFEIFSGAALPVPGEEALHLQRHLVQVHRDEDISHADAVILRYQD